MTEKEGSIVSHLGGIRRLLEDTLAPSVGRLDEKVLNLGRRCSELAKDVEKTNSQVLDLWKHLLNKVEGRLSNVEGRLEGFKEEKL